MKALADKLKLEVNPTVFFVSIIVILAFLIIGAIFPTATGEVFEDVQSFIVVNFGWFYIFAVAVFLVFAIGLAISKYGNVKLGPDDSEPEYSYASWFAMLFSAGMGIGLIFFSVAEPIFHYIDPPRAEAGSQAAYDESMLFTFFHWGVHAWAIYIIVGLSLAYFHFRRGLPLSIRSAFYPVLGNKIYGGYGDTIDILAVFGTMFGVATSLGLGVQQVGAGMSYVFGIENTETLWVILIAVITGFATISVYLGLDKGIRRLSNFNMTVAFLLIVFVFIFGPTLYLLNSLMVNTGTYIQNIVETTFWMDTEDTSWQGGWTLFYWGWWIAWSPFVGMFIARVSKGRTLREFIIGVMFVPTALTFIWLTFFGNTGLMFEMEGIADISGVETDAMLFAMLEQLPLALLSSIAATVLIITFFVTSSDSGSLVIDMLASGGNPDPPKGQRVFWALSEGAVAAVLLLAGGLGALQTASITTGLPFAVVLLFMAYSLVKGLRKEPQERTATTRRYAAKKPESE